MHSTNISFPREIKSVLIANRSEIAIRIMRAASEMSIRTVAIYSREDRLALHRFKADESYLVGEGRKPLQAYLDIDDILHIARAAKVDAIHPGYGFLSESPEFAEAVIAAGIEWVGPRPEVMRTLGNKVAARNAAVAAGVPVMPATPPLPLDLEWPAVRLPQRLGLRHPARCRHGLRRRLLRFAAGQGHGLGAHGQGVGAAHGPRLARMPHSRRSFQSAVPGERVDILPYLSPMARRSSERKGRGFLPCSGLRLTHLGGFLLRRGCTQSPCRPGAADILSTG